MDAFYVLPRTHSRTAKYSHVLNRLHAHSACSFCMLILHAHSACAFCMLILHAHSADSDACDRLWGDFAANTEQPRHQGVDVWAYVSVCVCVVGGAYVCVCGRLLFLNAFADLFVYVCVFVCMHVCGCVCVCVE